MPPSLQPKRCKLPPSRHGRAITAGVVELSDSPLFMLRRTPGAETFPRPGILKRTPQDPSPRARPPKREYRRRKRAAPGVEKARGDMAEETARRIQQMLSANPTAQSLLTRGVPTVASRHFDGSDGDDDDDDDASNTDGDNDVDDDEDDGDGASRKSKGKGNYTNSPASVNCRACQGAHKAHTCGRAIKGPSASLQKRTESSRKKQKTDDADSTLAVEEEGEGEAVDDLIDHCELCGNTRVGETLLLCDGCDRTFHPQCVDLEVVPEGDWFCSDCVEQTQRDAASGVGGRKSNADDGVDGNDGGNEDDDGDDDGDGSEKEDGEDGDDNNSEDDDGTNNATDDDDVFLDDEDNRAGRGNASDDDDDDDDDVDDEENDDDDNNNNNNSNESDNVDDDDDDDEREGDSHGDAGENENDDDDHDDDADDEGDRNDDQDDGDDDDIDGTVQ